MQIFTSFLYICSMEKNFQMKEDRKSSLWTRLATRFAGCFAACAILTGCGGGNDGLPKKPDDQETATTVPDNYEYRLPVVFHVLYKDQNDTLQYPDRARFELIIDSVNALYKRNRMNITFDMATEDESGKKLSEPGIMRHAVDFEDFDEVTFLSQASDYGAYTQNLKKFINIYVFRFKDKNTMGRTTLPVMTREHPLEGLNDTTETYLSRVRKFANPWGVCLNNEFIYVDQPYRAINSSCIWNTLAHELGHYLGLYHTFSEDGCDDTDYCEDTHNCNYTQYLDDLAYYLDRHKDIKSFYELPTRVDCNTGDEYYADNIMDYLFTLCETLTKQQRMRTRHVLNYSPLVPGLKVETTRGSIDIPAPVTYFRPRLSDCPAVPIIR